jgi:SM-20-related protein
VDGVAGLIGLRDEEVEALGEGLAVVRDGLLGEEAPATAEALRVWARSRLRPAGMGAGAARHVETLRGDSLAWLDNEDAPLAYARLLEQIRVTMAQQAWMHLGSHETQVARFPPGTRYVRHRDAFRGSPTRRLSFVLYLDADWVPEDGGDLVAHEPGGSRNILPRLDRGVFFLADHLEHEVLPAQRERWAVTTWFR